MSGRGRGRRGTSAQGARQADVEPEPQQAPPEQQQFPPEPQQAPQYLIDLMAPIAARLAALEERVASQTPPVATPPTIPDIPSAEEFPETTPGYTPPAVTARATEQETWLCLVERYQKMKAPEFQGSSDSIVAHQWKEDVSNTLDMLNVDTVQRQRLAAFSLKGDAGGWYRLQFTPKQRMTLTWEDFVYFFDEQYVSAAAKAGKELELVRLEQGDMSVAEYGTKFMELLRFTGMWQTGERQAQMFLMGLRPNLRRYLASRRFRSVREVADAAISQETEATMFIRSKDGNAKSGQPGDKGKGKRSFSGPGGPQQQGKGLHQQGIHKKGPQRDFRAQQQQRKFQGKCFHCNKFGHRAAECRSAPPAGQQGKSQNQQQQDRAQDRGQSQQLRIEAPPAVPRIGGQVRAIQEMQQGQIVPYVPGDSAQQPSATGRVYAVVPRDHGASGAVVEGTFLVNSFPARILFDSGASHSFISYDFVSSLQLVAQPLDIPLYVSTPLGEVSLLESVCRRCVVSLDDSEFVIDLIILRMMDFDVILGMDWLSSYHVSIDCFAKTVSLRAYDGSELVVATSRGNQFAESYMAYIEEVKLRDRGAGLSETRVVSEY